MPIDTEIFGSATDSNVKADSDIFKDAPASKEVAPPVSGEAPAFTLMGSKKPYTPEELAKLKDMKDRPWGSGYPKMAYDFGGAVTDFTKSPLAGYAANVLMNAIPTFGTMVKGLQTPTAQEQSMQALADQRQAILDRGRDLGLKVPPSQVNPSFPNRVIESVGGKAATAQQASAVNENVAYQVAQREAGLAPTQSINNETLQAARDAMSKPYRDIAALPSDNPLSKPPFKSPAETLEQLKDARTEAKQLWSYYDRQQIPQALRDAKAASAKADALEQTLEAQASAAGRPDLVNQLRQARVALAKNFTVQRAMRGSNFEPAALSRLESRANTPLSGDLETLMQMYRDFPKAMAAPQVGGSVGVNQLMPWLGGSAGGAIGAMAGGVHGASIGAPAGVILGQTVPPMARSLMLSSPYQALMANVPQGAAAIPSAAMLMSNPAFAGALYQNYQQ